MQAMDGPKKERVKGAGWQHFNCRKRKMYCSSINKSDHSEADAASGCPFLKSCVCFLGEFSTTSISYGFLNVYLQTSVLLIVAAQLCP